MFGGTTRTGRETSLILAMRERSTLATVEAYAPVEDRWERCPDLGTRRGWLSTSEVGGMAYVIGGRSDDPGSGAAAIPLAAVEVYPVFAR